MPEIDAPGTNVWFTRSCLNGFVNVRRCRLTLLCDSTAFTFAPELHILEGEKLHPKSNAPLDGADRTVTQVRLVNAFLKMRDDRRIDDDWAGSRRKVSAGYQLMTDALQEVRADDGKTTSAHHYSNEARLINWVLFGRFDGVDRDCLAQSDLVLMDKVEAKNAIWIARGRTYDERKAALPAFLLALRTKQSLGDSMRVLA